MTISSFLTFCDFSCLSVSLLQPTDDTLWHFKFRGHFPLSTSCFTNVKVYCWLVARHHPGVTMPKFKPHDEQDCANTNSNWTRTFISYFIDKAPSTFSFMKLLVRDIARCAKCIETLNNWTFKSFWGTLSTVISPKSYILFWKKK